MRRRRVDPLAAFPLDGCTAIRRRGTRPDRGRLTAGRESSRLRQPRAARRWLWAVRGVASAPLSVAADADALVEHLAPNAEVVHQRRLLGGAELPVRGADRASAWANYLWEGEMLQERIENFFEYKWAHDKNQAVDDEDEK